MSEAIALCPFCGNDKQHIGSNDVGSYWVCCEDGCGCEGPYRQTEQAAVEAWNTRASSSRAETESPVAWAYEFKSLAYGGDWQKAASIYEPKASEKLRNILPLYATPTSSHGELVEALKQIREKAAQGMSHGLTADATCEDILHLAESALANVKEG